MNLPWSALKKQSNQAVFRRINEKSRNAKMGFLTLIGRAQIKQIKKRLREDCGKRRISRKKKEKKAAYFTTCGKNGDYGQSNLAACAAKVRCTVRIFKL